MVLVRIFLNINVMFNTIIANNFSFIAIYILSIINNFPSNILWGSKTWALAVGLSTTIYQQYVRGEEIIGKPRN